MSHRQRRDGSSKRARTIGKDNYGHPRESEKTPEERKLENARRRESRLEEVRRIIDETRKSR